MIYQDANFKLCLSLFGWKENTLPKVHIVHCYTLCHRLVPEYPAFVCISIWILSSALIWIKISNLSQTHVRFFLKTSFSLQGLASYCKAETTFTFHFSILTLTNAFLGIDNREMKSESGFSFAIASQLFHINAACIKFGNPGLQRKCQQPQLILGSTNVKERRRRPSITVFSHKGIATVIAPMMGILHNFFFLR